MNRLHYIKVGWLIDGSGGPIQKKMLLTIENGMFKRIDTFEDSNIPDPATVTDLSRCTVLPPFIDGHVHLCMSGSTDLQTRQQQLTANFEELRPRIAEHVHHHFTHGVLALRDGGDRQGHALRYQRELYGKGLDPVILKTAGSAWHSKGRYGGLISRHPEGNSTLVDAFAGDNDPVDHVKLVNSGLNSLSEFGRETAPQFDLDEIKAFVDQARQKGKKVMVHANGRLPVRLALKAGCHSIEHGFFMGRENLKLMAETQTIWVPTAFTMKAYADTMDLDDSQNDRGVAEQNLHHQLKQMAMARQYGVNIALGTDAGSRGVLHGESVVEELKLILQAGYSLPEAIRCATVNGAKLLETDEIGRIAIGKPAHFIAARATPAMLPRKLSYLEAIFLGGRPCDKKFFHKM